jgi:eukaryotic-like serine/threonine-protein kinase
VDADVLELVRTQRLLEAARLSSERGDAATASALFERACEWRSAAHEALRAGEVLRGLELAVRGGDEPTAHEAIARLAADAIASDRAAAYLARRGHHRWAAATLEACGRIADAARSWERAGEFARAGALFERAGEPAHAARVLEAALRRDPSAARAAVALGSLLVRFGKDEAGVRVLQRVPATASERRDALPLLAGALRRLGMDAAASEAALELAALGGANPVGPVGATETAPFHGRYAFVRPIASSARARVLEALDRARNERVAIKVYASGDARGPDRAMTAAVARLEHDVRALRAIDHPSIVPVRELAPGPSVVMAWMEGGTLEQRLAEGPVAPALAAEIAGAILAALGEAHRVGVLHRDVKASNVLFDASGAARLSDFGAAHAADASATVTLGDLNVLAYASPEQREGREVTARSDLFAVGVLLEEMLTGRRPGSAPRRVLPSEANPSLDPRHDAAVASLTSTEVRARPTDAFQARDMLLALPWPREATRPIGATHVVDDRRASESAAEDRLSRQPDGRWLDVWTGRRVELAPLTEDSLERARLFTRADHPALQPVLRVDRERGCLWLAACEPSIDRPLSFTERARIEGAVDALHGAGAARGRVTATRFGIDDACDVVLLLDALASLGAAPGP